LINLVFLFKFYTNICIEHHLKLFHDCCSKEKQHNNKIDKNEEWQTLLEEQTGGTGSTWPWFKLVSGGYFVWRVITGGPGLSSCNPDPSWHQLVRTGTRIGPWKKCFARSKIVKKYFWKQGKHIYVKKLIFFSKLNK